MEKEIIVFLAGLFTGAIGDYIFHSREYKILHTLASSAHDVAIQAITRVNSFEAEVRGKLKI